MIVARYQGSSTYQTVEMKVIADGETIVCEIGTANRVGVPYEEWDALIRATRRERRRIIKAKERSREEG